MHLGGLLLQELGEFVFVLGQLVPAVGEWACVSVCVCVCSAFDFEIISANWSECLMRIICICKAVIPLPQPLLLQNYAE